MRDVKQCVYKYVYKDSIIYIGKTDASLKNRINGHSKEEKFSEYLDDVKIYFIKLKNKAETSFMETYLINKYKPKLNVVDVYDGDSGIKLEEPKWVEFSKNKPIKIYEDDSNTNILDESILLNIEKYGLKAKFTIDELISYNEEIQDMMIELHGCRVGSGWFCACGINEKIFLSDCETWGGYLIDINKFGENEERITVTKNDLKERYKNTLFISYLAIYDDLFKRNIKGMHPKFDEEFEKTYKMLTA